MAARREHTLEERITAAAAALAPAERRGARHCAAPPPDRGLLAVGEIAKALKVSTATVVRTAQSLGYDGIPALKQELQQDLRRRGRPSMAVRVARSLDELAADPEAGVDELVAFHVHLLDEARSSLRPKELRRAVDVLAKAERIVVFSYPAYRGLADYFALAAKRFGRRAISIGGAAEELLELGAGDALVMITYTQNTTVRATLDRARTLRIPVVLVTDTLALALKGSYTAALIARRGDPARYATGVMALVTLEALVLWLAGRDRGRSLRALERLEQIHKALPPQ